MKPISTLIITTLFILLNTSTTLAQDVDLTPVYDIQGDGDASPLDGTRVATFGLITGVVSNGFYLQDPAGDGDPQTSDGIYVYTRTRPNVSTGACVQVDRALVDEYFDTTELTDIMSRNISPSDRCDGTEISPVTISAARLRTSPGESFERVEGMVVSMDSLAGVVAGPTKRFNSGEAEIAFIHKEQLPYVDGRRIFQSQPDNVPALMYLSNGLFVEDVDAFPELGWGDEINIEPAAGAESVQAILAYNFGKYQLILLPDQSIRGTDRGFVDKQATAASEDDFTVCTFNVLGLGRGSAQYRDQAEYDAQLAKRALTIAETLAGCTIIGLQETGKPEDARNLADLLFSEYGLSYADIAIEGPMSGNRDFPLTNSFLVDENRVEILDAAQEQGCSRFKYDVKYRSGDCERGDFALFNRPPLVVDLAVLGSWETPVRIALINNHWKSKGGDETVNIVRREAQAAHVAALAKERMDAGESVVVLGDLNDFYRSSPVQILQDRGLVHAYSFLPALDRYTYSFNGGSQVLDHLLISPDLVPMLAEVDPVHINADYPYPQTVDAASVHHSSDHDPVVMRIRPAGASWLTAELLFSGIEVALFDMQDVLMATATSDEYGTAQLWDLAPGEYKVRYSAPDYYAIPTIDNIITLTAGPNSLSSPPIRHRSVQIGAISALATGILSTDE